MTDEQLEILRSIPIPQVMEALGYSIDHVARSRMYHSPFHDDKTPSFHILPDNRFYDHSRKIGGHGALDFYQKVRPNETFQDAVRFLSTLRPDVEYYTKGHELSESGSTTYRGESHGVVDSVLPEVTSRSLLEMLASRGLSRKTFRGRLSEVRYHIEYADGTRTPKGESSFFAVGWQNVQDAWSIRNEKYKLNIGNSDATMVDATGCPLSSFNGEEISVSKTSKTLVVFEGYMNYLSYIEMCGTASPDADFYILNSVNNLSDNLELINGYEKVHLFLDRDEAGRKATADCIASIRKAQDEGVKISFVDMSYVYAPNHEPAQNLSSEGYNDLNDLLKAEKGTMTKESMAALLVPRKDQIISPAKKSQATRSRPPHL